MLVRNKEDLELLYVTLVAIKNYARQNNLKYNDMDAVQKAKRSIRMYRDRIEKERQESGFVSVVKDRGDSYIELLQFPFYVRDIENGKEYFEECVRIHYVDRGYDCTGQAFTMWGKVFERNGRIYCYHCVGYDV